MTLEEFVKSQSYLKDEKHSLIATIGGDGTFIMTSQKIKSRETICLGINPEPKNSRGSLLGYWFEDEKDIEAGAELLLSRLEAGQSELTERKRIVVKNVTDPTKKFDLGKSKLTISSK